MIRVYSNSCKGFSHIASGKPCQDNTMCYCDPERTIIACCDGHGGDIYFRSDRGSRFACQAILEVFQGITPVFLAKYRGKEGEDRIRMELLCAWNKRVEADYAARRFSCRELSSLDEEKREELDMNKAKAYGTTLSGALLLGNKLIVASIGDGECLLMQKGEVHRPLEREEDPAANITYSLCQDDAYNHIRVAIVDFRRYDAVFLCTDGFAGPFQSYENLMASFLKPLLLTAGKGKDTGYVDQFVAELAKKRGTGDDVSLAYILAKNMHLNCYQ